MNRLNGSTLRLPISCGCCAAARVEGLASVDPQHNQYTTFKEI